MNPVYNILGFKMRLNWIELHHGYYGLFLMLLAYLMEAKSDLWNIYSILYVFIIGVYLLIDDIYQHHKQVDNPSYHSPVHNAFRFLY
jgi:hypothetical protein